jgi:hypothetical protein
VPKPERFVKTFAKGVGKTRSGKPSISVQTLIDRARFSSMSDAIKKAFAEPAVDDFDALEAAKTLSETPKSRAIRYGQSAGVAGAASPLIHAGSRALKGLLDAKKNPLRAARAAIKDTTRGGIAHDVFRGGATGMTLNAGREGFEQRRAKQTLDTYLAQHGEK